MLILTTILSFLLMLIIIVASYMLCRKFIFTKVRINKWIPLTLAIVIFAIELFAITLNQYARSGLSIVSVLFFLWFLDIVKTGGPKKQEKKIVIKSKAKPNRVKNKNK